MVTLELKILSQKNTLADWKRWLRKGNAYALEPKKSRVIKKGQPERARNMEWSAGMRILF